MRKEAVDFAAKKGGEMVGNKVTNMLQGNNEEFMPEKAESKAQMRLMGLALSVQRGDTPRSSVSPEVLKMVKPEMKEKDLKDFAGTKHEGLPEKVKKEGSDFSSPLVESQITENIAKQMAMKAKRGTKRKSIDRKASAAQQRVGLNSKKVGSSSETGTASQKRGKGAKSHL